MYCMKLFQKISVLEGFDLFVVQAFDDFNSQFYAVLVVFQSGKTVMRMDVTNRNTDDDDRNTAVGGVDWTTIGAAAGTNRFLNRDAQFSAKLQRESLETWVGHHRTVEVAQHWTFFHCGLDEVVRGEGVVCRAAFKTDCDVRFYSKVTSGTTGAPMWMLNTFSVSSLEVEPMSMTISAMVGQAFLLSPDRKCTGVLATIPDTHLPS